MKIQHIIAIIIAVSTASCASTYEQPKTEGSFATVTFEKGYKDGAGFGTASSQEYAVIGEKGCKNPERLAYLTWSTGKEKKAKVLAGKEIELMAMNTNYTTTGATWTGYGAVADVDRDICQSKVKFTPVAGENYRMKLVEISADICELEFVNLTSNEAIENAIVEDSYRCESSN